MRVAMVIGLIFASLFGWMALTLSAEWDMARVVGAIMCAYVALIQVALVFVRRWAREMST